eukprot:scaffold3497_cov153-Isochrysis_galbana.AAC.7
MTAALAEGTSPLHCGTGGCSRPGAPVSGTHANAHLLRTKADFPPRNRESPPTAPPQSPHPCSSAQCLPRHSPPPTPLGQGPLIRQNALA